MVGPISAHTVARRFFTGIETRDLGVIWRCYRDDAVWHEPIMGSLKIADIRALWTLVFDKIPSLDLRWNILSSDDREVWVDIVARLQAPGGTARVTLPIRSHITIQGGLIQQQDDDYSIRDYCRQAMGLKGLLMSWSPTYQASLRTKVRPHLLKTLHAIQHPAPTSATTPEATP